MTCPKRKQTDLQPNLHVLGDYGCGFEFCFKCHSSPQCGVTCRKPELAKQLVEKMRKERAERQQITFVRAKEWSEMKQKKQKQLAAKHQEVLMFQLSKEQVEEGWATQGHPFVSNKVARQFPGRSQPSFGKIVAYLSVEASGDGR